MSMVSGYLSGLVTSTMMELLYSQETLVKNGALGPIMSVRPTVGADSFPSCLAEKAFTFTE